MAVRLIQKLDDVPQGLQSWVAVYWVAGAEPLSKTVRNEKRKLSAGWCSTLAAAILTAGTFAPLAAVFYELTISPVNRGFLLLGAGICGAGGFALHFLGRLLLERLEEP